MLHTYLHIEIDDKWRWMDSMREDEVNCMSKKKNHGLEVTVAAVWMSLPVHRSWKYFPEENKNEKKTNGLSMLLHY